jgi:hypothetical protein
MNKEIKIDKQSILNAIKMIDEDPELLKGRSSFMYDLVYGNNTYPPILILSLANKLNGGEELVLNDFGGTEKPFKIIRDNGFDVVNKTQNDNLDKSGLNEKTKEHIKYIFETNLDEIEKSILSNNKGLSALCLLYKTKLSHQELSEKFGESVQFNNISTANVPEFINEISRYCDIDLGSKSKMADGREKSVSPLKNTAQKIFFGSPGTGKSYKVDQVIKDLDKHFYERVTFHPEFDHTSFVGGYKPVSDKDKDGNDIIKYKFVTQAFTNIYERAWQDLENQYYLVIEEINRGNCAEIFGDIFQLLDRNSNYTVSPSEELKNYLIEIFKDKNHDGIVKGLKLPTNLTIYATMNTSDQSLFPMDSAFKRRWEWEYVPINYEEFNDDGKPNDSFYYKVFLDDEKVNYFKWIDFIKKVNEVIEANENLGMDKCIGNYFIKSETKEITLHEFINKVIFYLWNDVFKDEDVSKSIFEKDISFEKFFPIHKNAIPLIEKILAKINVEILPKAE